MSWIERFRNRKRNRDSDPEAPTTVALTELTQNRVKQLTRQIVEDEHEDRLLDSAGAIAGMNALVSSIRGMTTIMEKDGDQLINGRL